MKPPAAQKNIQGDIVAILDSNGVELASYVYDAWGNVTAISGDEQLAENNPFRYRGYYQDSESGFFYLQSRYYDSGVGRFISGDAQVNPGSVGSNLFAYCNNNPIIYSDHNGEFALTISTLFIFAIIFILFIPIIQYMQQPQFIQAWNNFINNIHYNISQGLRVSGQAINDSMSWVSNQARSIARTI